MLVQITRFSISFYIFINQILSLSISVLNMSHIRYIYQCDFIFYPLYMLCNILDVILIFLKYFNILSWFKRGPSWSFYFSSVWGFLPSSLITPEYILSFVGKYVPTSHAVRTLARLFKGWFEVRSFEDLTAANKNFSKLFLNFRK